MDISKRLDELSDKYSLISDAIIYEADPNNIKFSLTTKADGKWEQNALNPLDESAKLYKFKVGEVDYEINTFKDRYAFNYDIFESTMGIQDEFVSNDPKSWAMAFADALDGSTDLTGVATQGLTNQFKVFGTVANATIDLIKKGVNLAHNDSFVGSPSPVSDLARVTLTMIKQHYYGSTNTGVYHYCCSEEISWYGFVEAILATAGQFDPKAPVTIEAISDCFPDSADIVLVKRQSLSCRKVFNHFGVKQRPWRASLRKLVKELYQFT